MKKFRNKISNRVLGEFEYEGHRYEAIQLGGYMTKQGWVGEPAFLKVDTVIDNIPSLVMVVKGDLTLEGEEVVRRWEDVMNKGSDSEYYVPREIGRY